jgi:hypothetical protein
MLILSFIHKHAHHLRNSTFNLVSFYCIGKKETGISRVHESQIIVWHFQHAVLTCKMVVIFIVRFIRGPLRVGGDAFSLNKCKVNAYCTNRLLVENLALVH